MSRYNIDQFVAIKYGKQLMEFMNTMNGSIQTRPLADIHKQQWKKYEHILTRITKSLDFPFQIEGLAYTETFKSGIAISIPLKYCDAFSVWAQSERAYISSFSAIAKRPKVVTLEELHAYAKDKLPYHLSLITQDQLMMLPIHYNHNSKGSIANLCIFVKKSEYFHAYVRYAHLDMTSLTQQVRQLLHQEYQSVITEFLVDTVPDHNDLREISAINTMELTAAEKSFLHAIYDGSYETKQIAERLNKSVRTIEGVMGRVVDKLECKNRYDLFVKVKNNHSFLSHII
ncbi:LuxR C-terminal-related transcriptional regulator [Caedibacter taeniospiralis]|jgi:DNA-binding CsgD family transcriptional regulator|uniref:LuxR C-terminal-related transcriptional regulator n=1 Tax=Caedibacter taeniospiralis TaxID=28907 RepID=UPI0037C190F0